MQQVVADEVYQANHGHLPPREIVSCARSKATKLDLRGFLGRKVVAYGVLSVVNNSIPINECHKNIAKLSFSPAIAKSSDL